MNRPSLLACLASLLIGCGQQSAQSVADAGAPPAAHDASLAGADAAAVTIAPDATVRIAPDAALASEDAAILMAVDAAEAQPDAAVAIAPDASSLPAPDAATVVVADAGPSASDAGCPRLLGAADRARKVILSHPFDAQGNKAGVYEVLDYSSQGVVSQPQPRVTFNMGASFLGQVVFTPDGEIGAIAQDDGTVGIFSLDASGAPTVIAPAYRSGFDSAGIVVMDPSGERFYVIDSDWPNNNGGVYSVHIGCDGTPTAEGKLFSSKNAYALALIPARPGQAFVFGKEVLSSVGLTNAHLLNWGTPPTLVASVAAFPDDDAIVSDARVTPDGRWALMSDNNSFSGTGNRIAIVELQQQAVRAAQVLALDATGSDNPDQVVPSPYGNAALVVVGQSNKLDVVALDPANLAAPLSLEGPVTYVGAKPQLPTVAVLMDRGPLAGTVLVSELAGIRQVRFEADGSVTDLGLTTINAPTGMEQDTGSMGVQP